MTMRRFSQLDVFASGPFSGNPLACVTDADGLSTEQMQEFTKWANLSESSFLLEPTAPEADYRVRIFTPNQELPFAGHPTIGSCQAWLNAGGHPKTPGRVVQECGVGLVQLPLGGDHVAFAAPPLIRSGEVEESLVAEMAEVLGIDRRNRHSVNHRRGRHLNPPGRSDPALAPIAEASCSPSRTPVSDNLAGSAMKVSPTVSTSSVLPSMR